MASPGRLVGRSAELAAALAALDAALDGRTSALLVAGEAGIGKTRLLEELERLAGARGVPVLWGRATNEEGAPPYWPWRQVLRAWVGGPGAGASPSLPAQAIAALARIAPEVAAEDGAAPQQPLVSDADERFALFEATCDLLAAASSDTGLVVVVDDLHWADTASVLLLGHLVRHVRDARLLVVAAFRPHEMSLATKAAEVVTSIGRQTATVRLDLGGLSAAEVGEHLGAVLGRPPTGDVVASVARRTSGNPLFVQEVGRLLAAGVAGLPDAVRDAIGERLGQLTPGCRRFLAAAALVGLDVDPALVAAVTDAGVDAVLGHLDEAVAAGLVTRPPPSVRHRFAHDLVRDCCALEISGAARARIHLATAEQLEGAGAELHLAEVAHHRMAALPLGDASRACEAATAAASTALDQLAFEEAARLYGWAFEAATAAQAGAGACARLLVSKAKAHHRAHDADEAMGACEEAVALARYAGDAEVLGRAALVLEDTSEPDWLVKVEAWCREAMAGLGEEDSALRAQLLAQHAMTALATGDRSLVDTASVVALAMAERVDDPAALATALRARQLARSAPDGVVDRLELADRMLSLGGRSVDPGYAGLWGHLWRFDALMQLGRIDDAEEELGRLDPVVRRTNQPLARWHLLRSRAAIHLGRGLFDEGRAAAERALAVAEAGGHPGAVFSVLVQLSHVSALTGELVVDPNLALPEPRSPWGPIAYPTLAEWYLMVGRGDEAERLYRLLPPAAWDPLPFLVLGYRASRAVLTAAFGDAEENRFAYEALLPHAEFHVVGGAGVILTRGSTEHFLGVAAAALGETDLAVAHLRRAVAINDAAGLDPCTAESRCLLAEVLGGRGAAGDRAASAALAAEAEAAATRLGMRLVAARAGALAQRGGHEGPLSAREREIALLVAEGLTNREIAGRLHIAHRTAENHVQHILTKLGYRTRSQIAAWATATKPDA